MREKRILIVGYGGAGKRFAENVTELQDDCEVVVLNTSHEKKQGATGKYELYNDLEQAKEKVYSAIIIAVPTSEHINYYEKLKDLSNVFLFEKPIDADFTKIERMAHDLINSEKKVFVNFQKRFLGSWQKAKSIIANGSLGEFEYGRVSVQSNMKLWRDRNYLCLYAAQKKLGGGAVLTECHEIDAINWFLGDVAEVSGVKNFNHAEIDVEDSTCYIGKVEGKPITFCVDMLSDRISSEIELKFGQGRIFIDTISNQLKCERDGEEETYNFGKEDCNKLAVSAFLNYVFKEKDSECFVDFCQAMKVSAVCEALREENVNQSFRKVELSLFPEEGADIINYVVKRAKEEFGTKLIAIYGMGSLGYGGYVNGWSDLDIDIIVDSTYQEARELFNKGKVIENEIQNGGYEKIDIRTYNHIHLNERKTILSFGQCSRAVMLIDSSKLICGTDITDQIIRPDIYEMNKEAFALCHAFFEKEEEYWTQLPWDDIAAFYALIARFIFSGKTGKVGGKRVALEYFIGHHLDEFPPECRMWFVWAYALRLDASVKNVLLQDCIKEQAVQALKKAFREVYTILRKETLYND